MSITDEALKSLKSNIDRLEKIAKELSILTASYAKSKKDEKNLIKKSSKALVNQLELVNEPVQALIDSIIIETKANAKLQIPKYERITTIRGPVYISKERKEELIKELGIEKKLLKKIKSKNLKKTILKKEIIVKPSFLASISNKIFYNLSSKISKSNFFKSMKKDLRKASMPYTLSSYVSIILFTTSLAFIIAFIIALAFTTSLTTGIRNTIIAIVFTTIVFFLALSWPSNMASSNKKKIDSELPFATSHMAAIASSKVEPSKIFSIMALTKEYPTFAIEMKKIVNQINIYGYDLTTALRNIAKQTPSRKLAELLNGMATTITTGGNLTTYLNEKAKAILLDYKLSHERYATIIGMYSDIYTALLIAAPLIFMLLLAIISIIGTTFIGMPASTLANLGIAVIIVLNIIFLVFLHLTQPEV